MAGVVFDLPILDRPQACEMEEHCLSSPSHKGEAGSLCQQCKWSPEEPESGRDYFRVERGSRVRFTRREDAEYQDRRQAVAAKKQVRMAKDKSKQRLGRKAAVAEKRTERNERIKSTRNSGRTNKDGDHKFGDLIAMDTKLQTGNINPVVNLSELAKIQADAHRAQKRVGVLILRNKNNQAVAVLSEADWNTILEWISNE